MKFRDLLGMSISSLWRRKLRTILTILGVVIGTASIVVMISLGLGLDRAQMQQIEQYGGLTTINVTGNDNGSYYGGGYAVSVSGSSNSDSSEPVRVDDEAIEKLSKLEHVQSVAPVLETYVMARQGVYEGQFSLVGTTVEALENMNMELAEGSELPTSETDLKLLYGNTVVTNFYNAKTNQYYWETGELPDVDLMNDPVFLIFDTEAYWNSKYGGTDENGQPYKAPKKYIIEACGMTAGGPEDYNGEASWNVYCNIEALKTQLKKVFKGKVIPGQPSTKAGKPYKEIYYNRAEVKVTDMKYMEEVQEEIRNMGYNANSNIEWITQMREQSRSVQAALGGIGAVSLFVAAIGIANTMMMSIYERTKEIGIIKVLGCDLSNIRNMFLAEAAFIGLIGGAVGLVLSYIISGIINFVMKGGYYEDVSYIPLWLTLIALFFAMIVGMLSGLFPALRAMRLSALSAIRNE